MSASGLPLPPELRAGRCIAQDVGRITTHLADRRRDKHVEEINASLDEALLVVSVHKE
jgi:hypothetical protein